jgi:hypothetical protein
MRAIEVPHGNKADMNRKQRAVLAAGLLISAIATPHAVRVLHAQDTKCYFKDCIVFENGSRICTVREVACPPEIQ